MDYLRYISLIWNIHHKEALDGGPETPVDLLATNNAKELILGSQTASTLAGLTSRAALHINTLIYTRPFCRNCSPRPSMIGPRRQHRYARRWAHHQPHRYFPREMVHQHYSIPISPKTSCLQRLFAVSSHLTLNYFIIQQKIYIYCSHHYMMPN